MNHVTRTPLRVRHRPRFRQAKVIRVEPVSPLMRRITFGGSDLTDFSSESPDDHVKLVFPERHGDKPPLPELGPDGMSWPGANRPVMRDYTPRRFDPAAGELTVEFVLHGDGPAARWASRAEPGQWLGIGGPRSSLLIPDDYRTYLLIGDETALPAIARRLEEMPPGVDARLFIEVADTREERYLPTAANASIRWLHRNGAAPGTPSLLLAAIAGLTELPVEDTHAWVACELEVARALRRRLIDETGLRRDQVKAGGYWRIGIPGGHGKAED